MNIPIKNDIVVIGLDELIEFDPTVKSIISQPINDKNAIAELYAVIFEYGIAKDLGLVNVHLAKEYEPLIIYKKKKA